MSISHSWNGTILTITSDSGTSSADLKGDTGCRGPQGPAGVVYDAEGNVVVDLNSYYNKDEIDNKLADCATEDFVNQQITTAVSQGKIDLSDYATKNYVDAKITYGTADLTAGVSSLAPGVLYCVIEE